MHIGLVGLGRMGSNMRTRLREHGIEVTGFDKNPDVTDVATLADLVAALPTPRTVWVMVPAGDVTHAVVTELVGLLDKGDLVIDGGDARFQKVEQVERCDLATPELVHHCAGTQLQHVGCVAHGLPRSCPCRPAWC